MWSSSRACVCRSLCLCVVVVFVTCDMSVNVLRLPCFSRRQYPSALYARSSQAAAGQDAVPVYMSPLASCDRVHPWCRIVRLSLAEMARKIKRWYAIAKPSGLELGQMTHRGLDTLNLEAQARRYLSNSNQIIHLSQKHHGRVRTNRSPAGRLVRRHSVRSIHADSCSGSSVHRRDPARKVRTSTPHTTRRERGRADRQPEGSASISFIN